MLGGVQRTEVCCSAGGGALGARGIWCGELQGAAAAPNRRRRQRSSSSPAWHRARVRVHEPGAEQGQAVREAHAAQLGALGRRPTRLGGSPLRQQLARAASKVCTRPATDASAVSISYSFLSFSHALNFCLFRAHDLFHALLFTLVN